MICGGEVVGDEAANALEWRQSYGVREALMCSEPQGETVVLRVVVAEVLSVRGGRCSVALVRLSWAGVVAGILTARDHTESFRGMRL